MSLILCDLRSPSGPPSRSPGCRWLLGRDAMTAVSTSHGVVARERSTWRTVAIPTEHGGWGLTLEPVLLGVIVAFSWSGVAVGLAAFLAFLVRTPVKLALIDRRRHRSLPRTRLATRLAIIELAALVALVSSAVVGAGTRWLVPVACALPLFAIELWFDVRSRGRRLVPELSGAVGISAVAASIVIAGGGDERLAVAAWMILAARSLASIPYVRTQIARMRHTATSLSATDAFQLTGATLAVLAVAVDDRVIFGTGVVMLTALAQSIATRRDHIAAAKVIGMRQMAIGLTIVAATATGALM